MSSLTLELQATWSELPQVRNSVPPSRTHSNVLTSLMVHLLYILVKRSTLCPETQTTSPLRVWSWRTLMFRYLEASFSWKSMTWHVNSTNQTPTASWWLLYQCLQIPNPCKLRWTHVLHKPLRSTAIWPGEFIEMTLSDDLADFTIFAGEPSSLPSGPECTESSNTQPPPHILNHDADKICITNLSHEPQVLSCNVHFSRVQSVFTLDNQDSQPPQDDMTQPLTSQSKRKDHQLFSV